MACVLNWGAGTRAHEPRDVMRGCVSVQPDTAIEAPYRRDEPREHMRRTSRRLAPFVFTLMAVSARRGIARIGHADCR